MTHYVIRGTIEVEAEDPQAALVRVGDAFLRAGNLEGPLHAPEAGVRAADLQMVWKHGEPDEEPDDGAE